MTTSGAVSDGMNLWLDKLFLILNCMDFTEHVHCAIGQTYMGPLVKGSFDPSMAITDALSGRINQYK